MLTRRQFIKGLSTSPFIGAMIPLCNASQVKASEQPIYISENLWTRSSSLASFQRNSKGITKNIGPPRLMVVAAQSEIDSLPRRWNSMMDLADHKMQSISIFRSSDMSSGLELASFRALPIIIKGVEILGPIIGERLYDHYTRDRDEQIAELRRQEQDRREAAKREEDEATKSYLMREAEKKKLEAERLEAQRRADAQAKEQADIERQKQILEFNHRQYEDRMRRDPEFRMKVWNDGEMIDRQQRLDRENGVVRYA